MLYIYIYIYTLHPPEGDKNEGGESPQVGRPRWVAQLRSSGSPWVGRPRRVALGGSPSAGRPGLVAQGGSPGRVSSDPPVNAPTNRPTDRELRNPHLTYLFIDLFSKVMLGAIAY